MKSDKLIKNEISEIIYYYLISCKKLPTTETEFFNMIKNLFEVYFQEFCHSIDDLENLHEKFTKCLFNELSFLFNSKLSAIMFNNAIKEFRDILSSSLCSIAFKSQKSFTTAINKIMPNGGNILDVGSGFIPLSSIMLAQSKKNNVSSIDKSFESFTNQLKPKFNVSPIPDYITPQTETSQFDIIVGNSPCGGTIPLIKNAVTHNKPYLIKLCNCGSFKTDDPDYPYVPSYEIEGFINRRVDSNIRVSKLGNSKFVSNLLQRGFNQLQTEKLLVDTYKSTNNSLYW